MNNQDYEQKKRKRFVQFCKDNGIGQEVNISIFDAFDQIFDRAFALGKQFGNSDFSDAEDTVIQGWVARDEDGHLFMYSTKPERDEALQVWIGRYADFDLRDYLFPDLTWDSDPEPVEITIKRKKNGNNSTDNRI